jgi:hypothetical protein
MKKERFGYHENARSKAVQDAIERLKSEVADIAEWLYDTYLSEISDKYLKNGKLSGNVVGVNTSSTFKQFYSRSRAAAAAIIQGFDSVAKTIKEYYLDLFPEKTDFNTVLEKMMNSLGYDGKALIKGGYLYNLTNDNSAERRVKAYAMSAIRSGKSYNDFRKELKGIIVTDRNSGKLGVVEGHYYTNAYTAFSEFDRSLSYEMAKKYNLKYAVWTGATMLTSRSFCKSKKGKVFSIEQLKEMDSTKWQGKIPGQSTLISQGGYGCIDSLLWVTDEYAKEIGITG